MPNYWLLVDQLRNTPAEHFFGVSENFINRILSESLPQIELLRKQLGVYENKLKESEQRALNTLMPIFENVENILKDKKIDNADMKETRGLISGEYRSTVPLPKSIYNSIRYAIEGNLDIFSKTYQKILTSEKVGITYVDYNKFRIEYPDYYEYDIYFDNFTTESEYLAEFALARLENYPIAFSILSKDEIDTYARPLILKDLALIINFIEYPLPKIDISTVQKTNDVKSEDGIKLGQLKLDMKNGFFYFKDNKWRINPEHQSVKFLALLMDESPAVVSYGKIKVETNYGIKSNMYSEDIDPREVYVLKRNLRSYLLGINIPKDVTDEIMGKIISETNSGYRLVDE